MHVRRERARGVLTGPHRAETRKSPLIRRIHEKIIIGIIRWLWSCYNIHIRQRRNIDERARRIHENCVTVCARHTIPHFTLDEHSYALKK